MGLIFLIKVLTNCIEIANFYKYAEHRKKNNEKQTGKQLDVKKSIELS